MSAPLVSVIMPVYNREKLVRRGIESVFAQRHENWEIIAIDDGSTDGTLAVLQSFVPRVRVLCQSNAGPYAARNLGLRHARGEFIAFLDSDDAWYPDKLERQLPLFSRPEIGLVFGDANMIDERSDPPRVSGRYFDQDPPARGRILRVFSHYNMVANSAVLARRACFDRVGPFSRVGTRGADYTKWVESAILYEFDYVPEPILAYYTHAQNFGGARRQRLLDVTRQFEELAGRYDLDRPNRIALHYIVLNIRCRLAFATLWDKRIPSRNDLGRNPAALGKAPIWTRLGWLVQALGYYPARTIRGRMRQRRPSAPPPDGPDSGRG
jgi:glycosyltransferase involved in cell wall biosynthesis